jgi:GT2 family glycosyltransferase
VIAIRGQRSAHAKRICAVVLNYRTPAQTFLAVTTLLASKPPLHRVLVVNNDAERASADLVRRIGGRAEVLHTGRNLGFSGGMNAGIREALAAGATHVLLVNSDMTVPPDCVNRLSEALDARPDIGIVGPAVLSRSDPSRVASLGMEYSSRTGRMRQRGFGTHVNMLDAHARSNGAVAAVSGCLMLIRREVFDAIGVFDEDYFFAFEDLDFCLRAKTAGFTSAVVRAAKAHHEGGQSMPSDPSSTLYFASRNHLLVARRTGSSSGPVASTGRAVSIVVLNIAHAFVSRGGSMSRRVGAVLRGVRDYRLGRFGPEPADAPAKKRENNHGL